MALRRPRPQLSETKMTETTYYAISMQDGSVALMQTVGNVTPEECLAKWLPDSQALVSGVPMKSDV